MTATTGNHADLMDQVYRWQRHFYDLTRKYYLFGRDLTIRELAPVARDDAILEIGTGTGRNLRQCLRKYPQALGFGVDISAHMLATARQRLDRAGLAQRIRLGQGDARNFDAVALFGQSSFERVMLPYCLSMMPDWESALAHAMTLVAPGGSVHVVDFGDQARHPAWARRALRGWLARFEVTPRPDLAARFYVTASDTGLSAVRARSIGGGYALLLSATRP